MQIDRSNPKETSQIPWHPWNYLLHKTQASFHRIFYNNHRFSSFSFPNAPLVGLHGKEYFRAIHIKLPISITQNVCHCNGQALLEMTPITLFLSDSLYFLVRPYIGPISSVLALYRALYFDLIWLAGLIHLNVGTYYSL